MYINQKDLLWGMDKTFVRQIMDLAEKETCRKGEVLFREGDPADHLYILTRGHVQLSVGERGPSVYIINHPGEGFGWSSLIDRRTYTATARCVEESQMYRIESADLNRLLEEDPRIGMVFFKKIAAILSNRLLQMYGQNVPAAAVTTFGTGQVQDYPESP